MLVLERTYAILDTGVSGCVGVAVSRLAHVLYVVAELKNTTTNWRPRKGGLGPAPYLLGCSILGGVGAKTPQIEEIFRVRVRPCI